LTPLAGARNSSETLDFIGPAASRPSAHAGEGAPEGRAGISRIFCPIGGIKSKNFVRWGKGRIRAYMEFPHPGLKIGFEPEI